MLFYSFFIISVIKIVICFIHYKNNDTFAEINCEKRMVMSWGKQFSVNLWGLCLWVLIENSLFNE